MTTEQPSPVRALLRRSVLAMAVMCDVDVEVDDSAVRLPGCTPLTWDDLARAAGPEPAEDLVRLRVWDLLDAHAELHRDEARTVPLAVPVGADRHPAHSWSHEPFLGGALNRGLGVVVARGRTVRAVPVPVVSAHATGRSAGLGPADAERLEELGDLVVERLVRDAGRRGLGATDGVLRPVGDCDVPTLLTSDRLREFLVDGPGRPSDSVLRAIAVPARSRGWFDLKRIDPAFAGAAWSATAPADRGFRRPVLVTRSEVALAPAGPRLVEESLVD